MAETPALLSWPVLSFLMRPTQWDLNQKPLSLNLWTGARPSLPEVFCRRLPLQQGSTSGFPLEVRGLYLDCWVSLSSLFLPGWWGRCSAP